MDKNKPNWQPTKVDFWHELPAPARPWPSEVEIFERYVVQKKNEGKTDALVLGSTVEFRSILHKHQMNTYVVDFSKEFYNILTDTQQDRMKHKGAETYYEANWLTMDLGKQFDLIFGDWVPGVLHTADYDTFFKNIIKHLKPNGLFVARECLRPDRSEVNLDEVVKRHYEKYADKYSFYESSMQYVYGYKLNSKTAMWDVPAMRKAWDDVCERGLVKNYDVEPMKTILEIEVDGSVSVMVKEDFENLVKNYLDIVSEHHVEEPSSEWYPIYVMQKKQ